jgi:hypothetical protein
MKVRIVFEMLGLEIVSPDDPNLVLEKLGVFFFDFD